MNFKKKICTGLVQARSCCSMRFIWIICNSCRTSQKKVRNLGILRNIPKEPSLCRPAESTLVTFFVSGFSRNHYLSDKFKHLKERSDLNILVLLYGIDKFVYSKFMYGHKWKVVYHFLSCRLRYEPKTYSNSFWNTL